MLTEETARVKRNRERNFIRIGYMILAILLEIAWLYWAVTSLNKTFPWLSTTVHLISFVVVLIVYGRHLDPSIKLPYIMLIMAFPIVGVMLYFLSEFGASVQVMRKRQKVIDGTLFPLLQAKVGIPAGKPSKYTAVNNECSYIYHASGYPWYRGNDAHFFSSAEEGLKSQIEELKKAQKYIFMEYHAVEDAESFAPVHQILRERAAAGLDVRLFYDDLGSIEKVNKSFCELLNGEGIKCRIFNNVNPALRVFMNNRDHRKLTIIDGVVGFTGGYNLSDEYFNLTHPFGEWKDTGVIVRGNAVQSMTAQYLEMWNLMQPEQDTWETLAPFFVSSPEEPDAKGIIQPYADSPLDEEHVGENVYLNMIHASEHYIYFMTPYLIIPDEFSHALQLAAKRGVDVRIITPGIPDKKIVFQETRSYYAALATAGVRIFEYTPGLVHAKECVVDDVAATCRTINLDYRSFCHHFENGVFFANCAPASESLEDFYQTFPDCHEVTEEFNKHRSYPLRIWQCILRLFAPLM